MNIHYHYCYSADTLCKIVHDTIIFLLLIDGFMCGAITQHLLYLLLILYFSQDWLTSALQEWISIPRTTLHL